MESLKVFSNTEFGRVRTITIDGEPWFVGKDVAAALGYAEPRSAISKKVETEDKGVAEMETPSGKQKMTTVNESGLYALIFGSKLESAKRFKHWVTSEVLPQIRKTGGYNLQAGAMDQLTRAVAVLAQVASSLAQTADSLLQTADRLSRTVESLPDQESIVRTKPQCLDPQDCYGSTKCKLETFPAEIKEQVDEMLEKMIQQQALNFSMISRYCTINGYTISQPSVKRYFQRRFSEKE